MLKCPECGSIRLYKDGLRYTNEGEIQRWLCRNCDYRFSEKLYKHCLTNRDRQICALKVKNLEPQTEKTVAGDKKDKRLRPLPQEAKGLIVKFAAYLEREGYYKDSTYLDLLVCIAKTANLLDPEDVKTVIARKKWKDSVKMLTCYAYRLFAKMENISWKMPRYKQKQTILVVPEEKDLDALIMSTQSKVMAAFLQCLKETFADPGEILRLEWKDLKDNVITINNPVKGHLPGQVEVSQRLIAMLNALPRKDKLVFTWTYKTAAQCLRVLRKRVAQKLQNPRLLSISFKSYRHWGGSMLAHYTNGNILTIKKMLRHKNVENTMKYIHTLKFKDEDFEIATATTEEEIKQLGSTGFAKYDEMNGIHFYRRPKKFGGLQ
jgi:integrase